MIIFRLYENKMHKSHTGAVVLSVQTDKSEIYVIRNKNYSLVCFLMSRRAVAFLLKSYEFVCIDQSEICVYEGRIMCDVVSYRTRVVSHVYIIQTLINLCYLVPALTVITR